MSNWRVLLNGHFIGIVESNLAWASEYWAGRSNEERRFTLQETDAKATHNPPDPRRRRHE